MSWIPPEHDRARELRAHLPLEGWRVAIEAIARRHALATDALAPFASGSAVVWSAGEHVVKLDAPVYGAECAAEARWLELVAGRLPVHTPAPVARGELAGWPYLVMTRVPGVALGSVWSELARDERLRLAAELGGLVRALHALDVHDQPDDWDAFWSACRADVASRHAKRGAPAELVREIDAFLARVGELDASGRVLLHTELLDQHVLVEFRDDRYELSALIDFADARVGPPAYETAAPVEFVFHGERGLLAAYLEACGHGAAARDPLGPERRLAWALCHRFGDLARMLRAVAPARPGSLPELARLLHGR